MSNNTHMRTLEAHELSAIAGGVVGPPDFECAYPLPPRVTDRNLDAFLSWRQSEGSLYGPSGRPFYQD